MSSEHLPISFICLNWMTTFERGCLVLPREFVDEYGPSLPIKVVLNLPSGASWIASFDMKKGTIEGLQSMITKYGLNQYNIPLMQYIGGADFEVRIFNCYAVEVDYSLRSIMSNKSSLGGENFFVCNTNALSMQQIELDKLKVAFKYNVCNVNSPSCEVKIDRSHVSTEGIYQILSKTHLRQLEFDESINYIHVGFALKKWKIEVLNLDDQIFFRHGWDEFAKSAGLAVGDICCFNKTEIHNSFEVAIYHMTELNNWNPPTGEELRRSRTFFLHMANGDSLCKAEIILPKIFAQRYAEKLESIVSLWMPDNNVWITSFRKKDNCLTGLHRLQKHYSIEPQSIIVFQYFGKSTFYMSILRPDGYDISNWIRNKMLVRDVVMDDDTLEEIPSAEHMSDDEEVCESSFHAQSQRFTVCLTSCNFDDKSHGVYIPRRVTEFYESWKPGMLVTLSYENEEWEVKGNVAAKQCRLGKGWSDFISESDLVVGQKITFAYLGGSSLKFEIVV